MGIGGGAMRSVVAGCLGLAGCVSAHSGLSARPLGRGAAEVGLHGGAIRWGDHTLPAGDVVVRAGVSDVTDVTLDVGMSGVGVGLKATATRPDAPVALAIAPQVSGMTLGHYGSSVRAGVPLLVGVPLGPHEVTVGPRVDAYSLNLLSGALARGHLVTVGATVDLSLRAGSVRLVPEIGALATVSSRAWSLDGELTERPPPAVHGNLFLLFERRPAADRR